MDHNDKKHFFSNQEVHENTLYSLLEELYPICRSITGDGVRKSLDILQKHISLKISEIPTNTKCYDWKIPREWNIDDAYIIAPTGEKIVDFKNSNLHVVSYSIPIKKIIQLDELKKHLHYLEDQPDVIPYHTSYYNDYWGFCISYTQFKKLEKGDYQVVIDSKLKDGSLTYGEYAIQGSTDDEILISTYICHPSLCNDNLSGIVISTILAKILSNYPTKYSYRFIFVPETIGAIAWISQNESSLSRIKHGLVATCLGDSGKFNYKKSRDGNNVIDQVVKHVLNKSGKSFKILDFWPSGSDERQFCSPGFNLPFGSLMKTVYDQFDQYHTSNDNLDFVKKEYLMESLLMYMKIIFELETNSDFYEKTNTSPKSFKKSSKIDPVFVSQITKCEPQLSKRGLYQKLGALKNNEAMEMKKSIQWLLNFSDGYNSLNDISNKSGIEINILKKYIPLLLKNDLLKFLK